MSYNEPVLAVMAAGMGSRYGGLKQMEPIGLNGELIIDFSLYDAAAAGFSRAIFIIKKEMEPDFRALTDGKSGTRLALDYAFQDLADLPPGYNVPPGRVKPWGTCHAVLTCRKLIDGPFAVINADDYYGAHGFKIMYEFLKDAKDDDLYRYAMVGYPLANTLTENGDVARGVCELSEGGFLRSVTERKRIKRHGGDIAYIEEGTEQWVTVPENSTVSMNFWGFTPSIMRELEANFPAFLDENLPTNPEKAEYLLPTMVDSLLQAGKASVKVLPSSDRWYGVTYKEDKPFVAGALREMQKNGTYPRNLW